MIAILSTDPVLYRMLQLELGRQKLTECPPAEATVWLFDLKSKPHPMPRRPRGLTVIGFGDPRDRRDADVYMPLPYDTVELQTLLSQLAKKGVEALPRLRHLPRLLMVNDKKIHLSPAEDAILSLLFKAKGEAVPEAALLSALHGEAATNILQVHIYRLRKKLAEEERIIKTVHSKGYALCGEIES